MGDWHDKQTIGLLSERAARRWGAREALAFQGKRWTFAELHAGVDAAAKGLLQLGIAPGDRVALWMVNRPEWLHAMFAIMKIGAVLVPVNTRFRTDDMTYVLGQSDAVELRSFWSRGSAPARSSAPTAAEHRFRTARCSGVTPPAAAALGSAPAPMR